MVVGYDNSLERAKGMYRNERDSRSKALAQTDFDTKVKFSGYSDYSNEFLGINGIRILSLSQISRASSYRQL